ncbi:MAG: cyclic nucleotide-binding domain-containing protein [Ignavibacteriales bacterium]|nr:cyclic nucleotide-binding domain-containing protein [Ignavibacteriales bacterium]
MKLADFKPGDFFGELALVDGETRSATARAKSDCKISVLFKPDFDSLLEKYPREGLQIMQGISKIIITRLRRLNTDYFALYDSYLQLKEQKNGSQH